VDDDATDSWVAFFDGTEDRGPRPLLTEVLQLAGPPREGGVALELGCGSGIETLALLAAGWRVVAMDASPEGVRRTVERAGSAGLGEALTAEVATFETYRPPAADLVYAGVSLPFCGPGAFPRVWADLRRTLRPGGLLGVHLFGINDTWAGEAEMNFHTRADVERLVAGLEVLRLDETEEDGGSFLGPKHWHVFEMVARRTRSDSSATPSEESRGDPQTNR
jgi:SAM-dependent methyltransferase